MTQHQLRTSAGLVAAITALAWGGPLYFPVVLLGPVLAGAVLGSRGWAPRAAAVPWVAAGLLIAAIDLAVTGEDLAFHLVVVAFTGLVAAGAAGGARRIVPWVA